jgi:type II secretory pathway predicted ATPase ExeA
MATKTKLRRLLERHGVKLAHAAMDVSLSVGAFNKLVNKGEWPKDQERADDVMAGLVGVLLQAGAPNEQSLAAILGSRHTHATPGSKAHKEQSGQHPRAARPAVARLSVPIPQPTQGQEDKPMLPPKQSLSDAARKAFGIARSPFVADVQEAADIYKTSHIRYITESLWQAAKHASFVALVGESGSGKTTLIGEFKDRVYREARGCTIIEPSVLYMEQNDVKGKTLKSAQIIAAIIHTISPSTSPKRDPEARARQVQQLLTDGHRAGQRYVLVIEEAHCLPTATLKHLKRFAEIKDGLAPLLSIVLVGQPELRERLKVGNADVREVAQRIDILELHALDNDLEGYLKFKLARVGMQHDAIFAPGAVDALRARLTFGRQLGLPNGKTRPTAISLAYPLAVANTVTAALNLAAELGAPVLDASIIKEAM